MRHLRYLLIPAILAIGIGIWYLNSVDPGAPPKDTIRTVRTAYPDETDLEDRFTLRAFVEADRTVTVLPLVSGTIQRMETDLGDAVAAGEVSVNGEVDLRRGRGMAHGDVVATRGRAARVVARAAGEER